jgi:hypothetical protein
MGPVVRVPADLAATLQAGDLVEAVVVTSRAVDAVDVELGQGGQLLELVEAPPHGYGELLTAIIWCSYVQRGPSDGDLTLVVLDAHGAPHPFPGGTVTEASLRDHLALAHYGDPGERRPIFSGG